MTADKPRDLAELVERLVRYISPYINASTPYAVEIAVLWIVHTYLLNIPDPEGPEVKALKEHRDQARRMRLARRKDEEILAELGPEPEIPLDPRTKKIKDPLGLYFSPTLAIDAPGPGVGKSTLLKVLHAASMSAWPLVLSPTLASIREYLGQGGTVLIDEAQRTFSYDSSFRRDAETLLNGSFELNAGGVPKMVPTGKDLPMEVKMFPVFAPLALAGINIKLPADVESRFIWITMEKGLVQQWDDRTSPLPLFEYGEQLRELVRPLLGMAYHHDEPMPPELVGREGDKWRPLIITADMVGGRWPDLSRQIAVEAITSDRADAEDETPEQALLYRDCAAAYGPDEERLSGAELIERLRPLQLGGVWGDRSGRPLNTTDDLARRLRSRSFRHAKSRSNGKNRAYEKSAFTPGLLHFQAVLASNPSDPSDPSETAPTLGSSTDDPWTA
ncbi:DUF3631 domain-containing protein [Galactobacter sp.]|uniref:DUF3631 domain-containing protein n=1 Tax=Galactobacter sp. TaxID=2676125 RepID=UPI0025BD5AE5|nr:DUF3631 domain-containing protein [Galactobacter sp.]